VRAARSQQDPVGDDNGGAPTRLSTACGLVRRPGDHIDLSHRLTRLPHPRTSCQAQYVAAPLPELLVADASAWREWLYQHHADSDGVWLRLAKKSRAEPTSLTYDQALEEALCFGWIDGQIRRGDETSYPQRFTPRRARSAWSNRNASIVARLIAEGRMRAAGLAEVERAKTDGRWEAAYDGQASMEVPADLVAALASEPKALAMFAILTSQNRYAVLYRINGAKRIDTRVRRIEQFVAMLARGETIYPQRRSTPRDDHSRTENETPPTFPSDR